MVLSKLIDISSLAKESEDKENLPKRSSSPSFKFTFSHTCPSSTANGTNGTNGKSSAAQTTPATSTSSSSKHTSPTTAVTTKVWILFNVLKIYLVNQLPNLLILRAYFFVIWLLGFGKWNYLTSDQGNTLIWVFKRNLNKVSTILA